MSERIGLIPRITHELLDRVIQGDLDPPEFEGRILMEHRFKMPHDAPRFLALVQLSGNVAWAAENSDVKWRMTKQGAFDPRAHGCNPVKTMFYEWPACDYVSRALEYYPRVWRKFVEQHGDLGPLSDRDIKRLREES